MPTQNLREKINVLNQMLLNADLEAFQLNLAVEYAAVGTGDAQVDSQFKSTAQNASAQLLAVNRRIDVCQAALAPLMAELEAASAQPAA